MNEDHPTLGSERAGAPAAVHGSPAPHVVNAAIQGHCTIQCATSPTLAQRIERRIRTRTAERIRGLAVRVVDGQIELHGHCATFYTKQLAQHAAMGLLDHEILVNLISVGPLN